MKSREDAPTFEVLIFSHLASLGYIAERVKVSALGTIDGLQLPDYQRFASRFYFKRSKNVAKSNATPTIKEVECPNKQLFLCFCNREALT